jgi:hypothetical protein
VKLIKAERITIFQAPKIIVYTEKKQNLTIVKNKKPTRLPRWVFVLLNLNWLAPASD